MVTNNDPHLKARANCMVEYYGNWEEEKENDESTKRKNHPSPHQILRQVWTMVPPNPPDLKTGEE